MRKSFKAGSVRVAEYFLISSFSVWAALRVVHSLCSGGHPCYPGAEFSNSYLDLELEHVVYSPLRKKYRICPLVSGTPSPNLNRVILINTNYPYTFITLSKLFPHPKGGACFLELLALFCECQILKKFSGLRIMEIDLFFIIIYPPQRL